MTKICFKVLLYLTLVARWGLHFGRGAEANEVTESLQGGEKKEKEMEEKLEKDEGGWE